MHERREIFYRFRLCIVEMISCSEPTLKIHLLRSNFWNYITVLSSCFGKLIFSLRSKWMVPDLSVFIIVNVELKNVTTKYCKGNIDKNQNTTSVFIFNPA